jgi:hypothetical protein
MQPQAAKSRFRGRDVALSRMRSIDGSSTPLSNMIVSITDAGGASAGQCLITTVGPHGLGGTPPIIVSNNSIGDYNVEHSVQEFPSTTTMITDQAYTTDGTGGTWAPA